MFTNSTKEVILKNIKTKNEKTLRYMPVVINALHHNVDNCSLISCPHPREEDPTMTGVASKSD